VRFVRKFQIIAFCLFQLLSTVSLWAATPVTCSSPIGRQDVATQYFVSLADYSQHLAHVSIRLPATTGAVILDMPVWNALYQVRDFAANVQNVRALDANNQPGAVENVKTSEWQVSAPTACVVVQYDIHLDNPGPFGAQLNQEHAFFNWAIVLMYSPATRAKEITVQLTDVPVAWGMRDTHVLGSASPGEVEKVVGSAHSYDDLVDSPVEIGVFQQYDFQQDGATYHIVVHANPSDYDATRLEEELRRVTHAGVDWMGDIPFKEYTFIYHFPHGHGAGGMEHAYGTAIDLNAERLKSDLRPVISVSAHEFFHLWNVKRIRPQSLEPIDYQHAMDTRALWFSEGVTSTVGDMLLARADISSSNQYIERVASEIDELQSRPAHRWQSAEDSGLDAWFEANSFYRTPQRSISYYNKGEVLGVLLDLRIRQATGGTKSLRDLFHWMNEHYAKKGVFFPDSEGVQHAAEEVTGQSFADFFRNCVAGTRELPYNDSLDFVGLQVAETTVQIITPGFETTGFLGAPPEVTAINSGSDAERAGLLIGDRILAVNGKPAVAPIENQLARMREGSTVKFRIANQYGLHDIKVKLTTRPRSEYVLQDMPSVTHEQRTHREAWIHGDDESGGTR